MKILQVNVVYKVGSTGKICQSINDELLSNGIESIVCYSRSYKPTNKGEKRLCGKTYSRINKCFSIMTGRPFSFAYLSTFKLLNIIKKEKPDIVHLHCLNGNFINIYMLLNFLKKNNIKTILTLHAEFMYTGGCTIKTSECLKWKSECKNCKEHRILFGSYFFDTSSINFNKMKKSFTDFKNIEIVGVSNWTSQRAKESMILKGKSITTIQNGIDINAFKRIEDFDKLKGFGIKTNKKIILSVNPLFNLNNKGGDLFLKVVERLKDEFQFVLVGSQIDNKDIISVPYVYGKKDLAVFYSCSSVLAFTSKYENLPTTCIEANCCGTPVVAFDVGGVKETIGENMGATIKPFDIDAYVLALREWANKKIPEETINAYRTSFSQKTMTDKYIKLYKKMCDDKNH